MPQTTRAAYLREKATNFRRLAENHGNAGNHQISDKLNEVAADFEGQADKLVIAAASEDLQRCIKAVGHGVTEALAASDAAARLAASASDQIKA
jgi:cytochrome c556